MLFSRKVFLSIIRTVFPFITSGITTVFAEPVYFVIVSLPLFSVYGSTLGIGVIEIIRFFDEDQEGEKGKQQPLARAACVLCALAAVAITFFHPVSDLYYYGCTVAIFGVILYRFVEVIRNYNRIAMRRLPQFDRQGGDDRA